MLERLLSQHAEEESKLRREEAGLAEAQRGVDYVAKQVMLKEGAIKSYMMGELRRYLRANRNNRKIPQEGEDITYRIELDMKDKFAFISINEPDRYDEEARNIGQAAISERDLTDEFSGLIETFHPFKFSVWNYDVYYS